MPEKQIFEIPQQLRELAQKNVEQARAAYGQFMDAMAQAVSAWSSASSGTVTSAALEKLHASLRTELIETVQGNGGHAAFMPLAVSIDIEIAQTHHLGRAFLPAPAHHLIEKKLGVTVDVQRTFVGRVFRKHGPHAVHGGAA